MDSDRKIGLRFKDLFGQKCLINGLSQLYVQILLNSNKLL